MSSEQPATKDLFVRLVDDAALFPPAEDPMDIALTGHVQRRQGSHGWMLGRFLCSGPKLRELTKTLDQSIELGLILSDPAEVELVEIVEDYPLLTLTGVELAPHVGDATGLNRVGEVPVYQEIDRTAGLADQLDRISERGGRAKLRTGGLEASAFPSVNEVARFITDCVARGLGFKCTSGLHNAVAHTDPTTGFDHYGFLNILYATHAAVTGDDVEEALATRDETLLTETVSSFTTTESIAIRQHFHGFGSCSFAEGTDDLVSLGLIDRTRES